MSETQCPEPRKLGPKERAIMLEATLETRCDRTCRLCGANIDINIIVNGDWDDLVDRYGDVHCQPMPPHEDLCKETSDRFLPHKPDEMLIMIVGNPMIGACGCVGCRAQIIALAEPGWFQLYTLEYLSATFPDKQAKGIRETNDEKISPTKTSIP